MGQTMEGIKLAFLIIEIIVLFELLFGKKTKIIPCRMALLVGMGLENGWFGSSNMVWCTVGFAY